jgi:phage repressor protein C with HTH and peptisase S24 domain
MVASTCSAGHLPLVVKKKDDLVQRFGRHLGDLRRARGLTQAELGEQLGIAQKNVHRLESGTQNLTLRTIEKVAAALHVDVNQLLRDVSTPAVFLRPGHVALASESQLAPRPIPVFGLAAAAGFARHGQLADVQGWALLDHPCDERDFVVRIEGDSMTPTIPDGAWCRFRRATTTPTKGTIVLVERERSDGGGRYLVKRLRGVGPVDTGGVIVRLESDNDDYAPLEIPAESEDEVALVGEFVEVVDAPLASSASRAPGTARPGRGRRRTAH